jgi:hypothetical protein
MYALTKENYRRVSFSALPETNFVNSRFEIFMDTGVEMTVFWDVSPCLV